MFDKELFKIMKKNCSKEVIDIIKKYEKSSSKDINNFIHELENYNKLNDFEKNLLLKAKEIANPKVENRPTVHLFDSGENIRKSEIEYNGDPFTFDGYEFIKNNKRL